MNESRTVLIADDDRAIRTVLSQALGRAGYQVRATSSAATLWRWVEDGEGDLVITDVVLPDDCGVRPTATRFLRPRSGGSERYSLASGSRSIGNGVVPSQSARSGTRR